MLRKSEGPVHQKPGEIIDWLNKVINESVLGSAMIRVINSQQLEYNKFIEANAKTLDLGLQIIRLFAALIPIIIFTANLANSDHCCHGRSHFVIAGSMTIGNFSAFTNYLAMLIFPILVIGFMTNVIAQATAAYQRINGVLQAVDPVETGTLQNELKGDIELKNVTVSFGEKDALERPVPFL